MGHVPCNCPDNHCMHPGSSICRERDAFEYRSGTNNPDGEPAILEAARLAANMITKKEGPMTGAELIAAERASHVAKGWDAKHDDEHLGGDLALAAVAYAAHAVGEQAYVRDVEDKDAADPMITLNDPWPWDRK